MAWWSKAKEPHLLPSSMELPPELEVVVQPNKYQKRRYTSDGPTRGQIKGETSDRLPTVRLNNYKGRVLMYMMACTSNGEPHPFFELQSVDKCGCQASMLDGRPAVITETCPEKSMEARFAACLKRLSIREVQNISEDNYAKWKHESEVVHLGFLAVSLKDNGPLASRLSSAIHMVQGKQPEMKRLIPSSGSLQGGNVICITGKNFPTSCNLKVRFYHEDLKWEAYGDVDSNDCSEKHLVVTVPRGLTVDKQVLQVSVEVISGATTAGKQKSRALFYCYQSDAIQADRENRMTTAEARELIAMTSAVRASASSALDCNFDPHPDSFSITNIGSLLPKTPNDLSVLTPGNMPMATGMLRQPWMEPESPLPPYTQPPSVEPMDVHPQAMASSQLSGTRNILPPMLVKNEFGPSLPFQTATKRRSSPDHPATKAPLRPMRGTDVFLDFFTPKPQTISDIRRPNQMVPGIVPESVTYNSGPQIYDHQEAPLSHITLQQHHQQQQQQQQQQEQQHSQHDSHSNFEQLLNPPSVSSTDSVVPPDLVLHHDRYSSAQLNQILEQLEREGDT